MNGFAIDLIIPMRNEPNHRSEMVSQLIFGEKFKVLEETKEWFQILTFDDNYIGWVIKNMVFIADLDFQSQLIWQPSNSCIRLYKNENTKFPLFKGIYFPYTSIIDNQLIFEFENYKFKENVPKTEEIDTLSQFLLQFLNIPYLWGGKTIYGFDCSGFVQSVFKWFYKFNLPRDAYLQADLGQLIEFQNIKNGDIAFFRNNNNKIIHVGIVLERNKIIHAATRVRIDNLDNNGIYCIENQSYSHELAFIKRIDFD